MGAQPAAVPDCSEVDRLAAVAGDGGQLAAVVRPPVLSANVARATGRAETLEASVDVPRPGRYGIWLGGSFRDGLEARVDGRVVGRHRHLLSNEGGYTLLGEAELDAGTHTVMLRFSGPDLHPGCERGDVRHRAARADDDDCGGRSADGFVPVDAGAGALRQAPRLDRGAETLEANRGPFGPGGVTALSIRLTARRSRRRRRCRRR